MFILLNNFFLQITPSLEIIVSILFFINKVLLIQKQKSGWLLGIAGLILGMIYFYIIELYTFVALDISMIVLMLYGYFFTKKTPLIEKIIRLVLVLSVIISSYFFSTGDLTVSELINSILVIIGTYFMADMASNKNQLIAWSLYFLSHIPGAYIGYAKNQIFFGDLQVASGLIAVVAIFLCLRTRKN